MRGSRGRGTGPLSVMLNEPVKMAFQANQTRFIFDLSLYSNLFEQREKR